MKDFLFYDNTASTSTDEKVSQQLLEGLRGAICTSPFRSFDEEDYPASYLAVVPTKESDPKIEEIMTTMKLWWDRDQSDQEDQSEQEDPCRYSTLDFDEIVKYFESEKEMNGYMNANDYVSNSWDPKDPQSDGVRPVSFAIVFDEYDDWKSMTYTLRGNASYFPSTEGTK